MFHFAALSVSLCPKRLGHSGIFIVFKCFIFFIKSFQNELYLCNQFVLDLSDTKKTKKLY